MGRGRGDTMSSSPRPLRSRTCVRIWAGEPRLCETRRPHHLDAASKMAALDRGREARRQRNDGSPRNGRGTEEWGGG